MSNRTSSSSGVGDITIVLPSHNGTGLTNSSDHDASTDRDRDGSHAAPKQDCGGADSSARKTNRQVAATPDNDGVEQSTLSGLLAGAAIVVAIVVFVCIVWRRRKRPLLFAPTPSLILTLHTQLDSPDPDTVRPSQLRPPSKRRWSTTTTIASDRSASTARRFSKASSTSSAADGVLLASACVDPVITAARIPLDEIALHEMVGRGAFGEVYRGTFDDHVVAVKRIIADRRTDLVYIEGFLSEAKFLARLTHPYIVQFIGVAWDSLSDLCVVSEYMSGGDLRSLLHRFERVDHRPKGFDAAKLKIALHIAHAVAYLHSQSPLVLHRDLKSRNVLLDQHHNAKLADFGVARERMDGTMSACVGTSLWMAPEVMVGDRYDEKADIYSLGVVLSEMDTHLSPYAHAREPKEGRRRIPDVMVLQMVSMGKLHLEFSASCDAVSKDMIALARQCVAKEPTARPTAAQVLHRIHLIYRVVDK